MYNKHATLGLRTCSLCELLGACEYQRVTCPYLGSRGKPAKEVNLTVLLEDVDFVDAYVWEVGSMKHRLDDDYSVLFAYYIRFINDCLYEIRNHGAAFVYKIEHIKDILRFEPDIRVWNTDGAYYVEFMKNKYAAAMRCKALMQKTRNETTSRLSQTG